MEPIVRFPYIDDNYQKIIVNEFKEIYNQAYELSAIQVEKMGIRMTSNRMLQFIFLIIFQFAFGLTKTGTMTLLSSGKADIVKSYIENVDKTFPGGSTMIQRVQSILDECEDEITDLAERVQDRFYLTVGTQARGAFAAEYCSKRVSMTPPPECFLGLEAPSKLFPDLTVEERGVLIPFFNARIYMRAKRLSGTSELVGEIKTPSIDGAIVFPLASKLGFFGGPPRSNAFYDAFGDLERGAIKIDEILNDKLANLEIFDLSVVSVEDRKSVV